MHVHRIPFVLLLAGCTAGDDLPAPVLSSISPEHALGGTAVTIQGEYLCQQPETEDPSSCANIGTVFFGQTPATVGDYGETMIQADVPELASASYPVSVIVAGRRSNAVSFTVDPR